MSGPGAEPGRPGLGIRPVTDGEFAEFLRALDAAAGLHQTRELTEEARAGYDLSRTLAVFDGRRIVGGTGSDVLELTLPGPEVTPVTRVTATGVLPTHRRRGLLTALMARQLHTIREAGEPLAILTAAEGGIYGRFGYGAAGFAMGVEVARTHADPPRASGHLRLVEPAEAAGILPGVFDRHRRTQPGQISRAPAFWSAWLGDGERQRAGFPPRFLAVAEDLAGDPYGYVAYRFPEGFQRPASTRTVWVEELVAATPSARLDLWWFCLGLDLVGVVDAPNVPVDDPLRWMLPDPRRVRVTGLSDFLWLRLVDVAAALRTRRYGLPGEVVLEVDDAFCPANSGRYRLRASADGAECTCTSGDADLALDVSALGSAFLGGVRFSTLAGAGRVVELRPGGLHRADLLFSSEPAPWSVTDW
jgi:predicted acetyltransferase